MQHFTAIEKTSDNPYLNLYHMNATRRDGIGFDYYFSSRNSLDTLHAITQTYVPEGIIVYAVNADNPSNLLMIREYRYPMGCEVYAMPAGLIDSGENASEAAIREIREETGLSLTVHYDSSVNKSGSQALAPGFSDETAAFVFGTVTGTFSEAHLEPTERLSAFYADKTNAKQLLKKEFISARTYLSLLLFLQSDPREPFAFLDRIM